MFTQEALKNMRAELDDLCAALEADAPLFVDEIRDSREPIISRNARRRAAVLLATACLLPAAFDANGQTRGRARPVWPKKQGVYVAASSEAIPAFPRALGGYRSEGGKDFWGRPFETRGTLRVGEGNGWTEIPDYVEPLEREPGRP